MNETYSLDDARVERRAAHLGFTVQQMCYFEVLEKRIDNLERWRMRAVELAQRADDICNESGDRDERNQEALWKLVDAVLGR